MKKLFVAASGLLLILTLLAAPLFAKNFGAPLTLTETTSVSAILADPDSYVGKTLQIKGLVVEVCAKRGCWINIAGEKPFEKLHVKVDDGVVVFPLTARGKTATVEGVWEKIVRQNEFGFTRTKPNLDKAVDPASVSTAEVFYQLRGLGAVIEGL
ncbi:DUF4920 domain-containing protein [Geoalkalibacter sp.]|jgi:hypothetical protein|uniref:DUF4920 domain-containing protein n=1 Tax=Geoalkalibacter sp. TaxID=3041440 RepID=UPI00272E0F64|nr:DUF4920 domain-containing protein [Geoalkalibacter sp.]